MNPSLGRTRNQSPVRRGLPPSRYGLPLATTTLSLVAMLTSCSNLFPNVASKQATPASTAPLATTSHPLVATATPGPGDIARLLTEVPPDGATVEVEAFVGHMSLGFEHGNLVDSRGNAPPTPTCQAPFVLLADRPYFPAVRLERASMTNPPQESDAWVPAVLDGHDLTGRRPANLLEQRYRVRAHTGDPRFAGCSDSRPILVLDQVPEPLPTQLAAPSPTRAIRPDWPRYSHPTVGYSFTLPPGWSVRQSGGSDLVLADPVHPAYPVSITVRDGEPDPRQLMRQPTPANGGGTGGYKQLLLEKGGTPGTFSPLMPLNGWVIACPAPAGHWCSEALLGYDGRTYSVTRVYPVGLNLDETIQDALFAIVDDFQVPNQITRTPFPTEVPIHEALDEGPFLSQSEMEAALAPAVGGKLELLEAQLVSEAEARRLGGCGPVPEGYPAPQGADQLPPPRAEAFWRVRGRHPKPEGGAMLEDTWLVNAKTGAIACTMSGKVSSVEWMMGTRQPEP